MSEHRMPEEVIRHYRDEYDEGQRLAHGLGQMELVRTREIVRRHLPDGRCASSSRRRDRRPRRLARGGRATPRPDSSCAVRSRTLYP
jgi:hypothetical protein